MSKNRFWSECEAWQTDMSSWRASSFDTQSHWYFWCNQTTKHTCKNNTKVTSHPLAQFTLIPQSRFSRDYYFL